jgi:hypothetical protein
MSQTKAQLLGPLVADNIDIEGDLNFDSGTLKVDPTNDRVGINKGANAPEKTLDVGGDVQLADLYLTADYPTIRPTLDLAFAQTKQLDSRITFTRSSTATYVDENGIIQTAAVNTPRFDHDPVTGESLGLLIEESRTNLVTYNEDFSQSVWTKQNGFSITSNTAIAPDGTLTADTASRVNLNAEYLYQNLNTPAGTYTLSCWIKSVNASSSFSIISYSGVDGSQSSSFTATNTWKRFSHTVTVSSTVTGFYPCIPSVSGEQFYIWGAQFEQGSFPTSYIPTSGSTVTRSSDIATITGTNFSSWYNQSESTITSESIFKYADAVLNPTIFYIGDGTTQNRLQQFSTGLDRINNRIVINSLNYSPGTITSLSLYNTTTKTALSFKDSTDEGIAIANGNDAQISSALGTLSGVNQMHIGQYPGGLYHHSGTIKRLTYYPRRLNNSQLQNITL